LTASSNKTLVSYQEGCNMVLRLRNSYKKFRAVQLSIWSRVWEIIFKWALNEGRTFMKLGTGNKKFTRYYGTVLENLKMKWKD